MRTIQLEGEPLIKIPLADSPRLIARGGRYYVQRPVAPNQYDHETLYVIP